MPFINVKNGCATGGSALITAHAMLTAGSAETALVVGFDKHPPGAFNPLPEEWGIGSWYGETGLMLTTQFFAMKIQRYMARARDQRVDPGQGRQQGVRQRQPQPQRVAPPAALRGRRCWPPSWSTTRCASTCSARPARARWRSCSHAASGRTRARSVYLRSAAFKTRRFGSFEVFSPSIPVHDGPSPTSEAAAAAFEQAGIGPEDIDVAQLQDTESGAEIMHLAETGLCQDGEQEQLIQSGATRIGGRLPVNTDGGCLANGEPIGASGLRQVHEVVLQLRGEAGERQIPGPARVGFTQVYGAPGVSACTVLST